MQYIKSFFKYLLILLIILAPVFSSAQSTTDPNDPNDPNDPASGVANPGGDPGTDAPIDGGVSLLVAAAIGYGAKKAHAQRKKQKEAEGTNLK
jgi:uncharacterized protein HemX